MVRIAWGLVLVATTAFAGPAAPPPAKSDDAAAVLARFKAATGGDGWDGVTSLSGGGTLSTGGLSGALTTVIDVGSGRSVSRYTLGPVSGADGFDGTVAWTQEPGGEVRTADTPEAKEAARTAAWMNALGYWYPARGAAGIAPPALREDNGAKYRVIVAKPAGGHDIALWFDVATGLLVRTVERQGGDTVTTVLDDYRDVSGVRLPFHQVSDRTDTAGRTDPRARTEIRFDRVATNVTVAAAEFAMPAMTPSARIDDPSGVTRVPFDLVNNHIYANATIGGVPVRVLVDTGGANVLTPAVAKRLGLASEGKLAAGGVGADKVDLGLARASEVRLGSAVLAKPVFYVIDLPMLPQIEGVEMDGLVGFEMFRRFCVTIDYHAHVLTLSEPGRFQPPEGAHVVPFELDERTPLVNGTLDGLPVHLTVDTGSRASLTLNSPFVRSHDLVTRYAAAPERTTGWGVGGPSTGRPARLGALTLGDVTVNDIAGDLFTGDKGAYANPDLSGNLGGAVLRRFTVAFDYHAKKMYLAPNADFAKSDPFDRSGLWLMKDGDVLKIAAVAPGSAAEKAKLRPEERIATVDGEPVAGRPLAEWRRRLAELPAGTALTLAVSGPSGERKVVLDLADAIPAKAVPR